MEFMLRVDRLIKISPQLFSICIDSASLHNLSVISVQLKDVFSDIQEIVCTFNRINLFFERPKTKVEVQEKLDGFEFLVENSELSTVWELPICFDPSLGEDLLLYFNGNEKKVHRYHKTFLSLEFRLAFYGFLPGFCYLSGLPNHMHLDRKSIPIPNMPKGAVAVGGEQLGIYPQSSPGGWQIIGHCPVPLINFEQIPAVFAMPGDGVCFKEIDIEEYHLFIEQIEKGNYNPLKRTNDYR